MFRYLGKLAQNASSVTAADITKLKAAGWSEEAIYDALTVAAVFKFYNTWNNGAGVQQMSSMDFMHAGNRLVTMGYCMDFSFTAILKVLWVGRKEVTYNDLKELAKILCNRVTAAFRSWSRTSETTSTPPDSAAAVSS